MRNLKKILALALALVMTLSLMTVANATFTDSGDIDEAYSEAVTVLSGLGVFKGVNDGSTFAPKQTITRGEVAAIIYRIVTGDVTDSKAGLYASYAETSFSDVKSTDWYAGYIGYCSNAQLIKGDGAGHFLPTATVNGYQALAMILRAVGYGQSGEFEGDGWEIRTASTATSLGLLKNVSAGSLGNPAAREVVAEILFQAISVPSMVAPNAITGYHELGYTLGYQTFGLEAVRGVLTANEYADLYGATPLAEGRTTLTTADGDVTLAISTEITDLGLSKVGYIAGKTATKTVLAIVDGANTVYETGAEVDIDTASKFINVTGMKRGDAEEFINFSDILENTAEVATYFRIHYVPVKGGDNKTVTYRVGAELDKDELAVLRASVEALIAKEDGKTPGTVTLDGVEYNVNSFAYGPNYTIKGINYDSWKGFTSKYLTSVGSVSVVDIDGNENGNWLKVIDNDGDGSADYILKTYFVMDAIADISSKGVYTMADGTKFDTEDKAAPVPVVSSTELAEGDVVVYAVIDGVCYAEVAQVVTETIDTKGIDYKAETITCGDTTYGQSAIGIDEADFRDYFLYDSFAFDVTDATTNVAYDLYLDFFGYVRAFTENKETFGLGLLTDGYYWTDNKTSEAKVDMVTADEAETEHNVSTAPNTDWTTFIDDDDEGANGSRGTWDRLNGFKGDYAGAYQFKTNVAAYAIGEDTTALYEVGEYTDIFVNTLKNELVLNSKSALIDQKLTAYFNDKAVDQHTVYATTSTVYYYVTETATGDLAVETWVGYGNAPKDLTLVAGEDHAYAVYTETRTSGRDYYYADVVVIEATSAQRSADFVYLANTKGTATGHNPSSYWLTTIGLDEEGAVDPDKYIGTEKTGVVGATFPWFYEIKAVSDVVSAITSGYATWGIYAADVVIGRDVYGRDYVYLSDGTSFPTETTPVYAVTYDTDESNRWVAYDVVDSAATKGDELIYVMSGKDVLYALNVTESTYKVGNTTYYILSGLYDDIVRDANYAEYTVTLVNNVANTTATLNTVPVTTVEGDDGVAQVDVVKGTKLTLTVKEDVGYVDGSYYVEVNNVETALTSGSLNVTITEDTVITIQGANEADDYVIWFAMGDDHKDIKPEDVIWDVEKTGAIDDPKDKAGYSFEGWYLEEDFDPDSKVENYEDLKVADFVDGKNKDGLKAVKLYAKITADTNKVTFTYVDPDGTPIADVPDKTFDFVTGSNPEEVILGTQSEKVYAVTENGVTKFYGSGEKFKIENVTEDTTVEVTVYPATIKVDVAADNKTFQDGSNTSVSWTVSVTPNTLTTGKDGTVTLSVKPIISCDNIRTVTYKVGNGAEQTFDTTKGANASTETVTIPASTSDVTITIVSIQNKT